MANGKPLGKNEVSLTVGPLTDEEWGELAAMAEHLRTDLDMLVSALVVGALRESRENLRKIAELQEVLRTLESANAKGGDA